METFVKELTWNVKVPVPGEEAKDEEVSKSVTFHELNRNDRRQHKLHGALLSVFTQGEYDSEAEEGSNVKMSIPSDKVYDLACKVIKNMAVIDENFTESDKNEVLNDSICLFSFGYWYLQSKAAPFLSNLKMI